jgi:hypothetical protein
MNDTAEAPSETCGHEFSLSGVGYRCERTPHPIDDGSNIPKAPYRHAAAIDAEIAEGTEEHEGQGEADLITWGEDETGEGQDWDLAWGDVTVFTDRSHGAYQEKP